MSARPNIRDVARPAGVSVGTVSNALNWPDVVSPDTLRRIEKAIENLGFVRNASATQLRTGSSPTVGVIVTEISNTFFVEAAESMERHIRSERCRLMMLGSSHRDPDTEARLLQHFRERNVRGVLLTPSGDDLSRPPRRLWRRISRSSCSTSPAPSATISSVAVDDVCGAAAAVDRLLDLGHRRIAFRDGPLAIHQARDRMAGARQAYEQRGLSAELDGFRVVQLPRFDAEAGATGMARMLRDGGDDGACTRLLRQRPDGARCLPGAAPARHHGA